MSAPQDRVGIAGVEGEAQAVYHTKTGEKRRDIGIIHRLHVTKTTVLQKKKKTTHAAVVFLLVPRLSLANDETSDFAGRDDDLAADDTNFSLKQRLVTWRLLALEA